MQKKISGWLKVLTIGLAVAMIAITVDCTGFIVSEYSAMYFHRPASFIYAGVLVYTCILCLLILFRFWKVCTEIGKGNSFSLENTANFRRMSLYSFLAFVVYPAGLVFAAVTGSMTNALIFMSAVVILVTLAFCIVCRCLAALIRNAYEIKRENDLTI